MGFYFRLLCCESTVTLAGTLGYGHRCLYQFQSVSYAVLFPVLNAPRKGQGQWLFESFSMMNITLTTYGFGMGAIIVFRSTLETTASD